MKTYRHLANWLIRNGHADVLREMVTKSMGPKDWGPSGHSLLILMSVVSDYLFEGMRSDPSKPFGSEGNRGAFFDVWLFIDCPGLEDQVVVATLREKLLWDIYMKQCNPPQSPL